MAAILLQSIRVDAARRLMGGIVSVHLRDDVELTDTHGTGLHRAAESILDRLEAWAHRLSRFEPDSELSRLNASPAPGVRVGPTLAAVLDWARVVEAATDGQVDVSMLDARLAAEDGSPVTRPAGASRRWSLARQARGAIVRREPGVRFDLDGVAKGWLADRALAIAPGHTALVDGDGDIAARVASGEELLVGVADPRDPSATLAVVRLCGDTAPPGKERSVRLGLATSGTTVHRWVHGTQSAHHLIDPATWQPAETDVVQATVLARSAGLAEAAAKAAVLAGVDRAPAAMDLAGVHGALLLTSHGELRATPGILPWLA